MEEGHAAACRAGRVQSVATRIVVERERERMAFRSAEYWDIEATLAVAEPSDGPRTFPATLIALDGDRIATGKDFEPTTGQVEPAPAWCTSTATAPAGWPPGSTDRPFAVTRVEEKPYRRRPYAPFITSTLQQEAARKLRFSSQQTMRTAQRLYENGYITYMRTDSVNLSETAIAAARTQIAELYGDRQRAAAAAPLHRQGEERAGGARGDPARRATRSAPRARWPSELSTEEFKLYELIWRRTIASQMTDAVGSVGLGADPGGLDRRARRPTSRATGKTITDPGFLRAYVESSDDADAEAEDAERRLPNLAKDQPLTAEALEAVGHTTQPPARYTEASLVKALEELGIGRPSTYASIMQTIQDRGYVFKRGQALIPSFLAFAVVGLLERHYPRLVDYDFTAAMEDELDEIAGGDAAALDFLTAFYFGSATAAEGSVATAGGLKKLVTENLGEIDARSINSIPLFTDDAGRDVVVRVGRYGPYLQRGVPGAEPTSTPTATESGGRRRPGVHPRRHRARRADPGEGRRAVPRRRRRAQARRAPGDRRADRAQVRPVRPVRVQRRDATRRCSRRSRRTR